MHARGSMLWSRCNVRSQRNHPLRISLQFHIVSLIPSLHLFVDTIDTNVGFCFFWFLFCSYLAQKLCFWRGNIFIGVYLSVCECVCLAINSKMSWPILMKFRRMMYYNKIQVPFEYEINRVDKMQTSPKRVVKIDIKATYL